MAKKAKKQPPKRNRGQQPKYTPEIAQKILKEISEGSSLSKACEKVKLAKGTVSLWTRDTEKYPDFVEQYRIAREAGYHARADEIHDLPDKVILHYFDENGNKRVDTGSVHLAKLKCYNLQWELTKVLPKIYGDKVDSKVEHSGSVMHLQSVAYVPEDDQPDDAANSNG